MMTRGCQMLVFPGAFNTTTGPLHWNLLMRGRAVDNQLFVAAVSPARDTANPKAYQVFGHSSVVSPWGNVLATCDEGEAVVVSEIDLALVDEMRKQIPALKQKRSDLYSLVAK